MQLTSEIVQREVGRRLVAGGWAALGGEGPIFTMSGSVDFSFDLRLGVAVNAFGVAAIYPSLGILHHETSRLFSQFKGLPPGRVCAFGVGLADVLYKHGHTDAPVPRWIARSEADIDQIGSTFMNDLEVYGMPVVRALLTVDAVIDKLDQEPKSQHVHAHLAVLEGWSGGMAGALSNLHEFVQIIRMQKPPMSTQSWKFVRSFVEYFRIGEERLPFKVER